MPRTVLHDFILIKTIPEAEKIGSIEISKEARSFEPDKWRSRSGTVILPGIKVNNIQEGDTIYFHYLTLENARQHRQGCLIQDENDMYALVSASSVYFAVRDGDFVPMNGYTIAEPCVTPKEKTDSGLYIPDIVDQESDVIFKVVKSEVCEPGDKIITAGDCNVPIEYDLDRKLGRKLYWIQNDYIYGVLT